MKFLIIFLTIFLTISGFAFADFYFSDTAKEYGTNQNAKPIEEESEEISSEYSTDESKTTSFFEMQGTNIINQSGIINSPVTFETPYRTHPFRYTEVTFILSSFLSYTYASFIVYGLDALENSFVQPSTTGRSRYKSLWISSTLFELTAGIIFGAAVAYDSYQRVYGKKKERISFNFTPYYEPANRDAGFMFSLSYPYD